MLTGSGIVKNVKSGNIVIDPFDEGKVGPNSYDLTLGDSLLFYIGVGPLDSMGENRTEEIKIPKGGVVLFPNNIYLGHTVERVGSDLFVPILHGRSRFARVGIGTQLTGLANLGWVGQFVLELTVSVPVVIYPFVSICQVTFESSVGEFKGYSGKYQGQVGPTV